MTHVARVLRAALLLAICAAAADAFNLEARLPIVKRGAPGSYFGFSVAEHVTSNKSDSTKWILVGAPLGQNLQPNTTRSGALFKCPITPAIDDCEQVITDGRRDPEDTVDNLSGPIDDEEIKEDQWMGVTVRSQTNGGKVLVCAHRYIMKEGVKESESQWAQGLCYLLSNEFEYEDTINPCLGRAVKAGHLEYGYCQAGTSGALFADGTMALGAPGPYNWRGTIFVQSFDGSYLERDKSIYYGPHTEQISPVDKTSYLGMSVAGGHYFDAAQMAYASGAPRSAGHGQVVFFTKLQKDHNQMAVVHILDGEQFGANFGYELLTADINGDDQPDLIVAAPLYFSTTPAVGGAVYVYQNIGHRLPANYTTRVTGQPESRFGQALANLGDINHDRCDDVAIGAPYEGAGVVYIYLGSAGGLRDKPSQVIRAGDVGGGQMAPGGRGLRALRTFGSSLSGGIDLDENQYPDLLVGAYESAVTVALLARPITNIRTAVTGVELRNIDPSRHGCDSDKGANNTCFTFRACCSIDPYELPLAGAGASASASSSSSAGRDAVKLQLEYVIDAETFDHKKKFSRVYFDGPQPSNVMRRRMAVLADNMTHCQLETVYLKEGTRDIQTPIRFRLSYKIVEAPLAASALDALNPILDQTQAVSLFEATFQKDCGDNDVCESQLYVNAELELEAGEADGGEGGGAGGYTLVLGEHDELRLNVSVSNSRESAYEAQLFVEHHASISYIGASKAGAGICNRYNGTTVVCALGNPLRRGDAVALTLRFDPSGLEDSLAGLAFRLFANSTSAEVVRQAPTVLSVSVVKKVELSVMGFATKEQVFYGGGAVRGESAMRFVEEVGPEVVHRFLVYNAGPWRAPYVEVNIMWPHQVANDKAQGKWLLYLVDQPMVEGAGGGECVAPKEVFNPLGLGRQPVQEGLVAPASLRMLDEGEAEGVGGEDSDEMFGAGLRLARQQLREAENRTVRVRQGESTEGRRVINSRVRRDRSMVIRAERLVDKEGKKTDIVHMDCGRNTAKCVQIKCTILNMQRNTEAYIQVHARLWNATLAADYPRVDMVNIVSHASIRVPDTGILQNRTNDRTIVETRAYPMLLDQPDNEVPIWIIIASIVGGLLLLALCTFCLWKWGFFKRRRPDPTLSGNLEKNKNGEDKLLLQQSNKS